MPYSRPGKTKIQLPGRAMGADTAEVFRELLGVDEAELAALKKEGVV